MSAMRIALWLIVAVGGVIVGAEPLPSAAASREPASASSASASQAASPAAPRTMSDIMVKVLYPTADAVFYIETRTPTDEAGWRQLQQQTRLLADAAG